MSQSQHIIIVDDEAPAREMVGDYLKMHGFGVTLCDGGKIAVAVSREHTNTIIRITDEGAGLSPEDLGRLFGRFQRLSAKPTGGESSTGLGLSITKRIIDLHAGDISVESNNGRDGSTFVLRLKPAADAPTP